MSQNIIFKHRDRLILTANPTSQQMATEEARNLFALDKEAKIDFYLHVAGVGLAELAPSSWMALQYGSLISVVVRSHGVPENSLKLANMSKGFGSDFMSRHSPQADSAANKNVPALKTRPRVSRKCTAYSDYGKAAVGSIKIPTSCDYTPIATIEPVIFQEIGEEAKKHNPSRPTRPGLYRYPTVTSPTSTCLNIPAKSSERLGFPTSYSTNPGLYEKNIEDISISADRLIVKAKPRESLDRIGFSDTSEESSGEKVVRPARPGFYRCPTLTSPKSGCLGIAGGSLGRPDYRKIDGTNQSRCQKNIENDPAAQSNSVANAEIEDEDDLPEAIVVQLEYINRVKNAPALPASMSISMEERFQVTFGKLASLIMEPPERIGLCLIRGSKVVNISPLSFPRLLRMKSNDRIRVRICAPTPTSLSPPQTADQHNGINWRRSFQVARAHDSAPAYTLKKDASLPSNPRVNKVCSQ